MRTLKEIDDEIDSCIKEMQNLDSNSETWIADFTPLAKTIKRLDDERKYVRLIIKRNKYDTMENYIKLLEQKLETMKTKQAAAANNLEEILEGLPSFDITIELSERLEKIMKDLKQE